MRYSSIILIVSFAFLFFYVNFASYASISTVEELEKDIEDKNAEIKKLEQEARKYRDAIALEQQRGKTLQEEIKRIDRAITKLRGDISLTEQKIAKVELEIEVLFLQMQRKELAIQKLKSGLAELFKLYAKKEDESFLEIILKYGIFSDFFRQIDQLAQLKDDILSSFTELKQLREELGAVKTEEEAKKDGLDKLKKSLRSRTAAQQSTKRERGELLTETKSQEKKYQELLREQERRRIALEEEVKAIEEKLRVTIDRSRLPKKGKGVLAGPLPDISLASCWKGGDIFKNCLTQYFGYTEFAAVGAYQGKGHNGIDFRAEVGIQVISAESGNVEAIGDTDLGCKGASYGKWILIRHPNNLSTLYAHLSAIFVVSGQEIKREQIIGSSGKSGYATGPHLHFGVFASEAVRVDAIPSKVCGRKMTLPLSPSNGYLNPSDYL